MEELNNAQPQAEATENVSQQENTPNVETIKVKYNHEDLELPYEEAVKHIQKGMNYDKVYEKLSQLEKDPRLSFVEDLAKENNMDVNEYLDSVKKWREQEKINKLVNERGIPEEVAQELMENRKFRQELEQEKKSRQEQEKQKADYMEFISEYPDVKPNEIPQEVWEIVSKGKSLVDAYTRYENKKLKQLQKNTENEKASPGSVTGQGKPDNAFFTQEQVLDMSREEVQKNWKQIMESRKKW